MFDWFKSKKNPEATPEAKAKGEEYAEGLVKEADKEKAKSDLRREMLLDEVKTAIPSKEEISGFERKVEKGDTLIGLLESQFPQFKNNRLKQLAYSYMLQQDDRINYLEVGDVVKVYDGSVSVFNGEELRFSVDAFPFGKEASVADEKETVKPAEVAPTVETPVAETEPVETKVERSDVDKVKGMVKEEVENLGLVDRVSLVDDPSKLFLGRENFRLEVDAQHLVFKVNLKEAFYFQGGSHEALYFVVSKNSPRIKEDLKAIGLKEVDDFVAGKIGKIPSGIYADIPEAYKNRFSTEKSE